MNVHSTPLSSKTYEENKANIYSNFNIDAFISNVNAIKEKTDAGYFDFNVYVQAAEEEVNTWKRETPEVVHWETHPYSGEKTHINPFLQKYNEKIQSLEKDFFKECDEKIEKLHKSQLVGHFVELGFLTKPVADYQSGFHYILDCQPYLVPHLVAFLSVVHDAQYTEVIHKIIVSEGTEYYRETNRLILKLFSNSETDWYSISKLCEIGEFALPERLEDTTSNIEGIISQDLTAEPLKNFLDKIKDNPELLTFVTKELQARLTGFRTHFLGFAIFDSLLKKKEDEQRYHLISNIFNIISEKSSIIQEQIFLLPRVKEKLLCDRTIGFVEKEEILKRIQNCLRTFIERAEQETDSIFMRMVGEKSQIMNGVVKIPEAKSTLGLVDQMDLMPESLKELIKNGTEIDDIAKKVFGLSDESVTKLKECLSQPSQGMKRKSPEREEAAETSEAQEKTNGKRKEKINQDEVALEEENAKRAKTETRFEYVDIDQQAATFVAEFSESGLGCSWEDQFRVMLQMFNDKYNIKVYDEKILRLNHQKVVSHFVNFEFLTHKVREFDSGFHYILNRQPYLIPHVISFLKLYPDYIGSIFKFEDTNYCEKTFNYITDLLLFHKADWDSIYLLSQFGGFKISDFFGYFEEVRKKILSIFSQGLNEESLEEYLKIIKEHPLSLTVAKEDLNKTSGRSVIISSLYRYKESELRYKFISNTFKIIFDQSNDIQKQILLYRFVKDCVLGDPSMSDDEKKLILDRIHSFQKAFIQEAEEDNDPIFIEKVGFKKEVMEGSCNHIMQGSDTSPLILLQDQQNSIARGNASSSRGEEEEEEEVKTVYLD